MTTKSETVTPPGKLYKYYGIEYRFPVQEMASQADVSRGGLVCLNSAAGLISGIALPCVRPLRTRQALCQRTGPASFPQGSNGAVRHCKTRSTARVQFWLPGPIRRLSGTPPRT